MDNHDVIALVDQITYKYGWKFWAEPSPGGGIDLHMEVEVPDARPDRLGLPETIHFDNKVRLLPEMYATPERLHEIIMHELWRIEYHEMREWYSVGGECYDNPHAITRV